MVKLSAKQKQCITPTGIGIIPTAFIYALHGTLHITWAVLDIVNMVSDRTAQPRSNPRNMASDYKPLHFENNLINSKVTIFS